MVRGELDRDHRDREHRGYERDHKRDKVKNYSIFFKSFHITFILGT
jgi:hypothetical protein